ncbi:Col-cuticle-N domain-containing protein [Aphelenchoides bicaudatus]|nr:Col-cuticle-N domain-containing protein [Aphelenchoides bicaudatus]
MMSYYWRKTEISMYNCWRLCSWMWLETDKASLRPVAFAAVVFSTVSISACLITFPLVFQYVQTLQATIQGEVEFCRLRSRDMWNQMLEVDFDLDDEPPLPSSAFFKRVQRSADDVCCTCQQGPPGSGKILTSILAKSDGPPGPPGKDGASIDSPGPDGPPGADAELHDKILPIPPQCPCVAPTGSMGPPDKL